MSGNPRMLACQKYEHDLPLAQAVAELRHEFGIRADAFVNNNPFDVVHDKGRQRLRRLPYIAV